MSKPCRSQAKHTAGGWRLKSKIENGLARLIEPVENIPALAFFVELTLPCFRFLFKYYKVNNILMLRLDKQ